MSTTLITPTGNRPEAFSLCERWMARQTVRWDQWIVVDDCEPATACTLGQLVIRPEPLWQKGQNTQLRNLAAAVPHITGDKVLVIEDDDWYAPNYIEKMGALLGVHDLVGENFARYFNLPRRRYQQMRNEYHASLCSTGLSVRCLELLVRAIESGEQFIDIVLWDLAKSTRASRRLFNAGLVVGIKGMVGRRGIGSGHEGCEGYVRDARFGVLREWIGEDVHAYLGLVGCDANVFIQS